jgi:mono/diheme cytochrome c family protein
MKPERTARLILLFLLGAAAGLGAVLALGLPPGAASADYEIRGMMPENGGWSADTLYAEVGQPLRLRLTSGDVLHSFAIGQSDRAPIDLLPGEWVETELVFDRPGRYTFYCTRWCGRNHWRMRGIIEVSGPGEPVQATRQGTPLYVELGIDIDAPRMAHVTPLGLPSAQRGAQFAAQMPAWALDEQTYRRSSPADVWLRLRAEPQLGGLSESELWDAVAYLWQRQTSPAALALAARLYAVNCAACHVPEGQGDGVMAEGLPAFDHTQGQMSLSRPPDLSDPMQSYGASPALLEGKLLRGGMGTGMPYWGPIFTEEELDALVSYLYSFSMDLGKE